MILINPKKYESTNPDPKSREIMEKTIAFFENKGRGKNKADLASMVWYQDFLDWQAEEGIFETLLTPSKYAIDNDDARWDTWRNCEMNEILGFYGLSYWYTWQVSILGLGPLWMSKNEEIKQKTARLLKEGGIFGFGLSEKEHGADVYSTDMSLKRDGDIYRANGRKYYIGNGNKAAIVSTLGKIAETGEFVFFAVDSQGGGYELVKNIVNDQMFVAEYALNDYAITDAEILETGSEAWDAALNTVNVGKFNLGWAAIGMCEHCFYESINHASNRILFGHAVTDFTHIKKLFMDAFARLAGMKLFAYRGIDYMRSASPEDRRYLLYDPMVKMKVTTQGEEVINLLWDVIAAKGFEKDMYFEGAAGRIRALPKLEGTVHVNMALIMKFMPNYFFNPAEFPVIPKRDDDADDEFLFRQGPTKGLGKIQFHDYKAVYDRWNLPNVNIFKEQIETFKRMLLEAQPDPALIASDFELLLILGEIFTLTIYGQLLLEAAEIHEIEDDLVEQMFDFMIRDFSKFALQLYCKDNATPGQMDFALKMLMKPVVDMKRYERVWEKYVYSLNGVYEWND
ncbi:MAG: acyl-CoA dehydrogenase family protein [Candidatus Geothermincolia bacterium]